MMMNEQIFAKNGDIFDRFIDLTSPQCVEILRQFSNLPTIIEKVDYILELLAKYDISLEYIEDFKNNKKSSDLRAKGNKLFSTKHDEEALEMYTYSIAVAENHSENLGLAYANRSAVLFRFGFFEECLEDIEKALESNYPEAWKPKILERKEKALNLKSKQKKIPYYQPKPLIDANDRNPLIECASNNVEIKNDLTKGRFLVATRDIEIGEIIAVESPTFTFLADVKWCHCYHCLKLCYNLSPCNSCTKALFCSLSCKDNSASYHRYECPILATIESLGYNSCRFLPLRIGISMRNRYENLGAELEGSDNEYKSGRYKEIHELITNEIHRSPQDLFERATCTAFFYKVLKDHTDFFESSYDIKDIFLKLVFQHLQTMACNSHSINETSRNSDGKYVESRIGGGAYNFMSLFNHSCTGNVFRTNYGTLISISAVETIKKGEQLFDTYGFHFGLHPKSNRLAALKKRYFFDCDCEACRNNWGTLDTLECTGEHRALFISLMAHMEDLENANLEIARRIRPTAIEALKRLEKSMPSYEFCLVQEMLIRCDEIFGNVRRSLA